MKMKKESQVHCYKVGISICEAILRFWELEEYQNEYEINIVLDWINDFQKLITDLE